MSTRGRLILSYRTSANDEQRDFWYTQMRDLIDREVFLSTIEQAAGYADKDWIKVGRPPFEPVLMFKVLILQKYHELSDKAAEHLIKEQLSFLSFLGLRLGDEVPDARTICEYLKS